MISLLLLTVLATVSIISLSGMKTQLISLNQNLIELKLEQRILRKEVNQYQSLASSHNRLIDKLVVMLGTKDPLAFQAVYGVTNPADDTVDYVSPDDESEARSIRDLTRSGEHAIEQDDEFASNGDIYPQ